MVFMRLALAIIPANSNTNSMENKKPKMKTFLYTYKRLIAELNRLEYKLALHPCLKDDLSVSQIS